MAYENMVIYKKPKSFTSPQFLRMTIPIIIIEWVAKGGKFVHSRTEIDYVNESVVEAFLKQKLKAYIVKNWFDNGYGCEITRIDALNHPEYLTKEYGEKCSILVRHFGHRNPWDGTIKYSRRTSRSLQ